MEATSKLGTEHRACGDPATLQLSSRIVWFIRRSCRAQSYFTLLVLRFAALSFSARANHPLADRFNRTGPFSAAHFPGHFFGLIPASGSFAASAFPVPPEL
ncbi:MAG: hypothetical protein DMG39_08840 [Acidobacteria bacterium]|nr:MAG: hypothetical protein DMG39_08840 [Acidobacteriota bacterium]